MIASGLGKLLISLAIFVIASFSVLPDDGRRWLFLGVAVLIAAIGAWQIDKASRSKGLRRVIDTRCDGSGMSEELELVSGMVSGLTIHEAEQAFLSAAQRGSGAAVAAGLATAGLAGAATGAGLAATSAGDAVQFFTCQLGERTVAGGFSKVTFKDGDEVSFVVARQPRAADRALAVIRPRDRTLWMSLHCSRGVRAHRRFAYGVFLRLAVGLPVFFSAAYLASSLVSFGPKIDAGTFHVVLPMFSTFGVVAAIYYGLRFYFQWRPVAQQAERIFAALGYPRPSRVDLPRDHKRYCKARGIKWPYLSDGPWIYHYLDPHEERASATGPKTTRSPGE